MCVCVCVCRCLGVCACVWVWVHVYIHVCVFIRVLPTSPHRCFGFVWKPGERSGYMCALFGELEPSQPVGAIVHFVNKLLANYKS